MKDTKKSQEHLLDALRTLPEEHRFTGVRTWIKNALHEIEHVETKRARNRQAVLNQIKIAEDEKKRQMGFANVINPKASLDAIERMIETEKNKLKKTPAPEPDTLLG